MAPEYRQGGFDPVQWGRGSAAVAACSLALMMGCPKAGEYRELGEKDNVTNTTAHEHHHDAGPHGGHIVELGEYHGEVTMGPDRVVTVYLLGGDAKTAVPVADATAKLIALVGADKIEFVLIPTPLDGEADGKTSRFVAAADVVPAAIKDIEDLKGDVIVVVAGKENKGPIEHHHGHDHDHDHDDKPKK